MLCALNLGSYALCLGLRSGRLYLGCGPGAWNVNGRGYLGGVVLGFGGCVRDAKRGWKARGSVPQMYSWVGGRVMEMEGKDHVVHAAGAMCGCYWTVG